MLFRFLDDGVILHCCTHDQLKAALSGTYPPNLPLSFDSSDCLSDNTFLDIHIIQFRPLRTSIFWKPTHTCSYISWGSSNVPRHIKTAWTRGEFIRYIPVCSSFSFYRLSCIRLNRALRFLRYPASVIRLQHIHCSERWKFLILHGDRPNFNAAKDRAAPVAAPPFPGGASLSQAEPVGAPAIDGPSFRARVLRVRYHSALPLLWPRTVHKLRSKLAFVPSMRVYAI